MEIADWAPYRGEFLALAGLHFLAVLAPGADFAITVRQSVRYGRWAGVATALGIGSGISVHVIYTLLGIAALLHTTPWMMTLARVLGAGYLLYLGIGLLRSRPPAPSSDGLPAAQAWQSRWQAFRVGFLTNATNPKATLFFLAVFTTIVRPATPLPVQMAYGVWMCAVNATWFMLVALLFSQPQVQRTFLAVGYQFERAMGVFIVLLAVRLGWSF